MSSRPWPKALALLASILLAPAASFSLDLFEGNAGYEGNWLHVLGSTAMTNRVYWQNVGAGVTYDVEFATDESFASPVLQLTGLTENFVSPDPELGAGSFFFRAREVYSNGQAGAWSHTGTLDVVEDLAAPSAAIVAPAEGQAFSPGQTITVQLVVADDTVLDLARFSVDGQDAGVLGLQSVDYKVVPSFGEARSVAFDVTLPAHGKGHDISVLVSDVMYKSTAVTVHIGASGGATTSSKGGRRR